MKEDIQMMKKEKVKKKDQEEQRVEFTFNAPDAKEVFLAGEFNNWDTLTLPMKQGRDGMWKAKVKLSPGRYEYKFFIDNDWVEELPGVEKVPNQFGTNNFIIQVT
jgi:1,4-alpha-glucan branching enzyme